MSRKAFTVATVVNAAFWSLLIIVAGMLWH